MLPSVSGYNNLVAAPNFPAEPFSNFNPNPVPVVPVYGREQTPVNPTFPEQTVQPVGWTLSTASTQRWPSDEQYLNSSNSSIEAPEQPPATFTLPIQKLQDLTNLEHAISSMQQYEFLLGHLQVLTIRHQANVNEMFQNFIADAVLSRVGFSRLKCGKYEGTMRDHFPRIMSALKTAWFPDMNRDSFEVQVLLLLKNSHTRYKQNTRRNPLGDIQNQSGTVMQPNQQMQVNGIELMSQWYQYAIYYRDRYQIAKKENQKLKANCEVSRRRVSRCLRKMNRLRQHVDVLEQRIDEIDG